MSAFVLAPGGELPQSHELHLLPFALAPTPATAPVSAYFCPRRAPDGHAFAGSRLAAFRGRAVVGQDIAVPRGYRGVLLRAAPPPVVRGGGPGVLTPAPSSASVPTLQGVEAGEAVGEAVGRVTRAMQKGAAQAALSRPRAARRPARAQKFKLDDDDEEEPPAKRRTVAKAEREATPERLAVPVINVVPSSPAQGEEAAREDDHMAREVDLSAPSDAPEVKHEAETADAPADVGALRVLTPTATFSRFTLWTPDAPLAGFRADEGEAGGKEGREGEEGEGVAPGWWRQGGAGEGGDEFVRALGEWLGLNEIIHEPTYLADMDDDE